MKLMILPFGDVDEKHLQKLSQRLSSLFSKIETLPGIQIPQNAFNEIREQYKAKYFIKAAREFPGDRVLGITEVDLYSEPLNFIFGQAEIKGRVCVISLHRLKGSSETYLSRTVKEAVHELGHTFGLEHCENERCVMHFSNCLDDTDLKGEFYCNKCAKSLIKKEILNPNYYA